MHRIDTAGHQNNQFADKDPVAGVSGTIVDANWLNAVQEETSGVIEAAGEMLVKGENNQLLNALKASYGVTPQMFGGKNDDTTDCSAALVASNSVTDVLTIPKGIFRISTSTTISASLEVRGGQIRVDAGVTLTVGGIIGDLARVVFLGDGTVITNDSRYSLGWFEGASADLKWDFLRRGLTSDKSWQLIVPRPHSDDPAAIDKGAPDGILWKLAAPMEFGDPENFASIELHAGFSAEPVTGTITSMWHFGDAAKTEVISTTGLLRLRGNFKADAGLLITGAGHVNIPFIYTNGTPYGVQMEASTYSSNDIKIGHIYGVDGVLCDMRATTGRLSEIDIGWVDSDGSSTTASPCLVRISGGCRQMKVGHVSMHAIAVGYVDCSDALVLIEAIDDGATYSVAPTYGIEIGKVSNRSAMITADGVRIKDTSAGAAPKSGHITINDVRSPGTDAVDLAWSEDIRVNNTREGNIRVGEDAIDTHLNGADRNTIFDSGIRTRINGRITKLITLADNSATSISIPNGIQDSGIVYIGCRNSSNLQSGIVFIDVGVAPVCYAITAGPNLVTTIGALTGTTGALGDFTVSSHSDGNVYFENRTGVSLTFFVEVAG